MINKEQYDAWQDGWNACKQEMERQVAEAWENGRGCGMCSQEARAMGAEAKAWDLPLNFYLQTINTPNTFDEK